MLFRAGELRSLASGPCRFRFDGFRFLNAHFLAKPIINRLRYARVNCPGGVGFETSSARGGRARGAGCKADTSCH